MAEGEVPKCHLHKKQNKACKFCQAFYSFQEQKHKQETEKKEAATMRLRGELTGNTRTIDETLAVPNAQALQAFPLPFKKRIEESELYKDLTGMSLKVVMGMIEGCSSCELEVEGSAGPGNLVKTKLPSQFICCIYNLMTRKLSRPLLDSMIQSRCSYLRCAAFLFIRLVMHPEQYWELLSPSLMDTEPVLPFPEETLESVPMGVYVQDLLLKDTYCDLILPRVGLGMRKSFEKRLLLYEQFRQRYAQNHEYVHVFTRKVPVEVCNSEGRWCEGSTTGPYSHSERCVTVPVQLDTGEQLDVSLGMIIRPDPNSSEDDLTQSRGINVQEMLDRYNEKIRGAALAVGKEYCKPVMGATRIASQRVVPITKGSKKGVREEDLEAEALKEEWEREAKKRRVEQTKHDERVSEITKKYCPGASFGTSGLGRNNQDLVINAPDRLRLG